MNHSKEVKVVIDKWNSLGLQSVDKIPNTTSRYKYLVQRIKENGLDKVLHVFDMVGESDFLSGKATDFKATFDWVINKSNFEKIQNGNYVNRGSTGIHSNKPSSNVFLEMIKNGVIETGTCFSVYRMPSERFCAVT